MRTRLGSALIFVLFFSKFYVTTYPQENKKLRVGLFIVATGKYIRFISPLIQSAEKFFVTDHERVYIIFTDHLDELPSQDNVIGIYQQRLGWPYDTMYRCKMYYEQRELCSQLDYAYACDADFLFVDTVGNEIFGDRVAVMHPGFVGQLGTPERDPRSTACISLSDNQKHYFAGGLYGGSAQEFNTINGTLLKNIEIDRKNGFIAVWHDESHLNRYFVDNPPTVILSPSYCYPEGLIIDYHPRILALLKNHNELRSR